MRQNEDSDGDSVPGDEILQVGVSALCTDSDEKKNKSGTQDDRREVG